MKKSFLFAFVFLCSIQVFSQSFSLDELMTLRTKSVEDFGTAVEAKGYKFSKSSKQEGEDAFTWLYSSDQPELMKAMTISVDEKGKQSTTYTFFSLDTYNKTKERLSELGFKFQKTTVGRDNDMANIYTSPYTRVVLVKTARENDNTGYMIIVYQNN